MVFTVRVGRLNLHSHRGMGGAVSLCIGSTSMSDDLRCPRWRLPLRAQTMQPDENERKRNRYTTQARAFNVHCNIQDDRIRTLQQQHCCGCQVSQLLTVLIVFIAVIYLLVLVQYG